MTRPGVRWVAAVVAVVAALATIGLVARVAARSGERVSVLASWTGAEETAFRRVLSRFTARHGIEVDYQGTRALSQVLLAAVRDGSVPDVAALPNPGELASYARRGVLHPLDDLPGLPHAGRSGPRWLRLEVDGERGLYAVAVKADLKSLVWYRVGTGFDPEPPRTWEQLAEIAAASSTDGGALWCMGMGSTPTSGWPGTDWIEDILLHQSGTDAYERWAAGRLPWTSPEVTRAWETWGEAVVSSEVHDGAIAALLTDFADAGRPMFREQPGCRLDHQASFIMGVYESYEQSPRRGVDFDFFPFPGFAEAAVPAEQPVVVSADLVGMFNDTPQARKLIEFLASHEAQRVWRTSAGGAFSLGADTATGDYPDEPSMRIARILSGNHLCFDASDLMPTTMANAFYHAVLEYLHAPEQLDDILADLQRVSEVIDEEEWLYLPCGRS